MIFVPKQRSRVNVMGIIANLFLPWLLFTAVYFVMAFRMHYNNPNLAWSCVLAAFLLCAWMAGIAYSRKQNDADPSWYTYSAGAMFVGTIMAAVFGNAIFFAETEKYFDYLTLNTYAAVNPAHDTGQMVMDSGRVYFSHGVHLDIQRTAGFKHGDTYCVVPIAPSEISGGAGGTLRNYDFWAVGVNCCDNPRKFHCGADFGNERARSGLRLMNEEQRPFFQLAVQQAEAAYDITAAHPIFFHWSQDPLKEIHVHLATAIRYFVIGSFLCFIVNFVFVMSATFAFVKMGRS